MPSRLSKESSHQKSESLKWNSTSSRIAKWSPRPKKSCKKIHLPRTIQRLNKLKSLFRTRNWKERSWSAKRESSKRGKDRNSCKRSCNRRNKLKKPSPRSTPASSKSFSQSKSKNRSANSKYRATNKSSSVF